MLHYECGAFSLFFEPTEMRSLYYGNGLVLMARPRAHAWCKLAGSCKRKHGISDGVSFEDQEVPYKSTKGSDWSYSDDCLGSKRSTLHQTEALPGFQHGKAIIRK